MRTKAELLNAAVSQSEKRRIMATVPDDKSMLQFHHVERFATFPNQEEPPHERINNWLVINPTYKIHQMYSILEERAGGRESFIYVVFEKQNV